jgi:hypothetical protein
MIYSPRRRWTVEFAPKTPRKRIGTLKSRLNRDMLDRFIRRHEEVQGNLQPELELELIYRLAEYFLETHLELCHIDTNLTGKRIGAHPAMRMLSKDGFGHFYIRKLVASNSIFFHTNCFAINDAADDG